MRKLENSELGRLSAQEFKESKKTPLILVLDDVRSLNNIGSIFRTADAFRVEKIILCGITATPPNKEIHKTALGATESVHWEYVKAITDALMTLRADGVRVYALEQVEGAVMLDRFVSDSNLKYALVLGNEVHGVSQEAISHCDGCIEIPQLGTKHSLNVAVSAGVAVWEFFRQMAC